MKSGQPLPNVSETGLKPLWPMGGHGKPWQTLFGKPEKKRQLPTVRYMWVDNIKIALKQT